MKVTIELEVSNLQDLAGMIAGAADGVLANAAADQEPGKVEAKVETKAKPEPDTESEEKPVHTKAEIEEMLTQFCMGNAGGAAKVQAEFKAIGVASLSEASVEQLNEVVAKLGLSMS